MGDPDVLGAGDVTEVAPTRTPEFPVIEVFGPVVQGEGPLAGQVTHFIRFGLCDYRCSWCDSLYAVLPEQVRVNATRLTMPEIVNSVNRLGDAPWVTLSGGNPAIHDLMWVVVALQEAGYRVAVETQGSKWQGWLAQVDMLIVSPKPPSSGMVSDGHMSDTLEFMARAGTDLPPIQRAIKIVVFDEVDLAWAEDFLVHHPWGRKYLSVGTPPPEPGETIEQTRQKVCDSYRWLCERVPNLAVEVTVLPQLHVLAYGHARGV